MPKMSQICEELRDLEGHKHTYPNSFIYISILGHLYASKQKWSYIIGRKEDLSRWSGCAVNPAYRAVYGSDSAVLKPAALYK